MEMFKVLVASGHGSPGALTSEIVVILPDDGAFREVFQGILLARIIYRQ